MQGRVNSKAEQVYDAVKEAILSGELEPGQAIDKLALCERLGVSRFPVSAAISRLAFERLVRVEPQHGSFVSPISADDVREHLFIRRALESEVAAEAALKLDEAARGDIAGNLAEAEEAAREGNRASFYIFDVAFHALLTQHLGLRRSEEILDDVRQQLERPRRLLMTPPGRMQETLAEHRAIFAAVEARDPEAARGAMAAHIAAVSRTFEALACEKPELFAP
jgi:GntR family transcriptional regulator, rspAB operon transcriptional repressor